MRTQLEIIVRANRAGVSLFLQAFINLFSVVIWIIIAFYSQSYTGEDSVGMLGTGLFGVISSMLVGLSMVSDAGIFSLITMINIFTLAVIMIMTYQAIAAKRAQVRKDKVLIAYNGIKLRILFIILTICTIAMFLVIPAMLICGVLDSPLSQKIVPCLTSRGFSFNGLYPVYRPLAHRPCPESLLIEADGIPVLIEAPPLDAAAAALCRDCAKVVDQGASIALSPVLRSDVEILYVEPRTS